MSKTNPNQVTDSSSSVNFPLSNSEVENTPVSAQERPDKDESKADQENMENMKSTSQNQTNPAKSQSDNSEVENTPVSAQERPIKDESNADEENIENMKSTSQNQTNPAKSQSDDSFASTSDSTKIEKSDSVEEVEFVSNLLMSMLLNDLEKSVDLLPTSNNDFPADEEMLEHLNATIDTNITDSPTDEYAPRKRKELLRMDSITNADVIKLQGIGKAHRSKLAAAGITTIGSIIQKNYELGGTFDPFVKWMNSIGIKHSGYLHRCHEDLKALKTKDMLSDVESVINEERKADVVPLVDVEEKNGEGDVEISASNNHEIVYFDLETTGFSIKTDEITQIAAQCDKQQPFNVYIKPVFGISKEVEKVTGLSVRNGEMLLHGKKVETTPLSIALLMFIQFLRNIGKRVILVAHNGFRFDARFLMRVIHYNGLWNEFEASVIGFADTLPIFKEKLPDRKKTKRKFNQTDLGIDFLGKDAVIGLHNALKDIELLIKLLKVVGVTQEDVKSNAKSLNTIIQEHNKAEQTAENKATMDCLKGAISDGMITRIAKSGINFTCLQLAYETGEGAIEDMLSEDIDGRPRVTKTKKILNNLCMRMAELNNH